MLAFRRQSPDFGQFSEKQIEDDDAKACLEYKSFRVASSERICNQASKDNECFSDGALDLVDGVSRQRK